MARGSGGASTRCAVFASVAVGEGEGQRGEGGDLYCMIKGLRWKQRERERRGSRREMWVWRAGKICLRDKKTSVGSQRRRQTRYQCKRVLDRF